TLPEQVDGRYTGKVSGTPSFKEGKITRLNEWLETNHHTLKGSFFYSDSHNDLPLLKLVSTPVSIDPDDTLREYSEQNGWPIQTLRS
ncbi:HAD family phosphatase, partial [Oleiphilus sp. HI0043]